MNDRVAQQNRLCASALAAEEAGRLERAAEQFRAAVELDDSNPTPYLFLGHVLQRQGQDDHAAQVWSLAADLDRRLVNAWRRPAVAGDVRLRSKAADTAIRRHFVALHQQAMDEFESAHTGCDIARIRAAVWCQTHDREFSYRTPEQRPHVFYVPGLPPVDVYPPGALAWLEQLEAASDDIRAEFLSVRERAAGSARPYLTQSARSLGEDWEPIAESLNWGALHLYKRGQADESLLALFPGTLAVLASAPLLTTPTGPSEILFSSLQGGKHIPPHFGLANTDIAVHLPVIATDHSAIRVNGRDYPWQYGRAFAFDDSFRHESWNDADSVRVNLLFEAWHPDLTEDERAAVSAAFEARDRWNRRRSIHAA